MPVELLPKPDCARFETERKDTDQKIAGEREALAGELQAAYMNGQQEEIKLLLNQRDPQQVGRMMTYYGYLSRARVERITAIGEHLAHLELLTESIGTEARKLQSARSGQRSRSEIPRRRA